MTTLLAAVGFSSATTLVEERQSLPAKYYLQTKVVSNTVTCGTDKNGLWVYSYHTGAGLGDVGLSSNKSWAWEGYLNGTQQLFTYPNNEIGPWPLAIQTGTYQRTHSCVPLGVTC